MNPLSYLSDFVSTYKRKKQQSEWRLGLLSAIDRRMFPKLEPLCDVENSSEFFAQGFKEGLENPLACSFKLPKWWGAK